MCHKQFIYMSLNVYLPICRNWWLGFIGRVKLIYLKKKKCYSSSNAIKMQLMPYCRYTENPEKCRMLKNISFLSFFEEIANSLKMVFFPSFKNVM